MATFTHTLLKCGTYEAPQGTLVVTPARATAWVAKFRAMRARGIRVPMAWGHQPKALPDAEKDRARKQFWLSRYNAGYVHDLSFDPATQELRYRAEVPGAELDDDGNLCSYVELAGVGRVKTAIKEVSAAIKDWRDGTGKDWPDSIVHVALVPLPVVAGQQRFKPAPAGQGGVGSAPKSGTWGKRTGRPIYLSLGMLLSGDLAMADEKEDKPKGEKKGEEGGGADHFKKGMEVLTAHGISLPEDTTPENFWERLVVAGSVLDGAETPEETPLEEEPEEPGAGAEMEEPQPVMMSLTTAKTPAEKKLFTREQNRHRADLVAKIDRLQKRGMPVAKANKFRSQISGYELSLTADGETVSKLLDIELSAWDEALPKKRMDLLKAGSVEQPQPSSPSDDAEMAEYAKKRAEAVSLAK